MKSAQRDNSGSRGTHGSGEYRSGSACAVVLGVDGIRVERCCSLGLITVKLVARIAYTGTGKGYGGFWGENKVFSGE